MRRSHRARRVRVRVLPDGQVELVLPEGADAGQALAFAESQRAWIERTRTRLLGRLRWRLGQSAVIPEVIELPALGERWRIEQGLGSAGVQWLSGRVLRLTCSSPGEGLALLRGWLRQRAADALPAWLERVAAETGLTYLRVQVRLQRGRWGSCSSRGTISLNAKLLLLPPELARYLMVHELCHTRVMNHSPAFWRLVERLEPAAAELDRALRRAAHELPAWLDGGCEAPDLHAEGRR